MILRESVFAARLLVCSSSQKTIMAAPFTVLYINPYLRRSVVLQLAATPANGAPRRLMFTDLEDTPFYAFAADAHLVPRTHFPVMAPLVHAFTSGGGAAYTSVQTLGLGVRELYRTAAVRGMLWTLHELPAADTPERNAIPGFMLTDGGRPNTFWSGCAVLALYSRDSADAVDDRAFLEVTARMAITWERAPSASMATRVCIMLSPIGRPHRAFEEPECATCATRLANNPKRCAACVRTYYCDAACQQRHWARHKALCNAAAIP